MRKLVALALLAFIGGGAVFVSIESETTALVDGPTVARASHPPVADLAAPAPPASTQLHARGLRSVMASPAPSARAAHTGLQLPG